jgi:hypothetical protein
MVTMMNARVLLAVGIIGMVGRFVLAAQTPASPAFDQVSRSQTARTNGTRLASLPDNPCDLLTREQVAVASGLEVVDARRAPDIRSVVEAQDAGRDPAPGIICSYDTRSEFGTLMVVVPPPAERTAASYRQAREKAFMPPSLAQVISGLGEDAWSSGSGVHVLTGQGEYFVVGCQKCGGRSAPAQLVAIARAVMDRLR